MTFGFRAVNSSGIVSIDEDSTSYVYLGKTQITDNDVYFHCVGYPLVFFSVPYNVRNENEGINNNWRDLTTNPGIAMRRLRQAPGDPNTWIATFSINLNNLAGQGMYVRIFGLLHLNFPFGAGAKYGARAWDSQGRLIFDTGCRQLRLAGNSYDTELQIGTQVAGETDESGNGRTGDTVVGVPFDLGNKSIMANTRGAMLYPYTTGYFKDWDTGQDTWYIQWLWIDTLFWATGNALYARKSATGSFNTESTNNPSVFLSNVTTYTRVAVIDNNLFP
jgi:hypothetical protein